MVCDINNTVLSKAVYVIMYKCKNTVSDVKNRFNKIYMSK